jgi:nucleoside-triphosphatase THEP1
MEVDMSTAAQHELAFVQVEGVVRASDEVDLDLAPPHFAILVYDDGIGADRLLAESADALARAGYKLAGVVQSNIERPGRSKCDMRLTDLSSGEEIAISHDLGVEAKGCRLDHAALVQASVGVERALAAQADLLIINKFGKQEVIGGGLRTVIAEAIMADVPVVLGVSKLNLDAFLAFAGAPVARLDLNQDAIVSWCREAVRRRSQ